MKRSWIFIARRIGKMSSASGKVRALNAVGNVALMALGGFFCYCVKLSWDYMSGTNFILGLFLVILAVAAVIFAFFEGFICQIALVFISALGLKADGEEGRGGNIAALIISLITSVGLVAAAVIALIFVL